MVSHQLQIRFNSVAIIKLLVSQEFASNQHIYKVAFCTLPKINVRNANKLIYSPLTDVILMKYIPARTIKLLDVSPMTHQILNA
jgi:hypothetical protein